MRAQQQAGVLELTILHLSQGQIQRLSLIAEGAMLLRQYIGLDSIHYNI